MANVAEEEAKKVEEAFNRIVSRKLEAAPPSRWTSVFVLTLITLLIVAGASYYFYKQRKGKPAAKNDVPQAALTANKVVVQNE